MRLTMSSSLAPQGLDTFTSHSLLCPATPHLTFVRLPELWAAADLTERRRLLLTVLDAVYVDAREARAVVSIRPKAAFEAVSAELLPSSITR